jgi:NAD(P)-dependent dehydrogenase (short-subunit alcohol dehydrogenase family)
MAATELKGKVAIVTGGGRGIGRAIATQLAAAGAVVCVTARSEDQIDETARLITAAGGRALAIAGDVSCPADVERVVETARALLGPVRLVVNNAGVHGSYAPVWCSDPDDWWRTVEIDLRGPYLYSQATFRGMIEAGGGRIINVASSAGKAVIPSVSAYGVAKAALIRFTEFLALEGSDHGVFAFAISPGTILTDIGMAAMTDAGAQRWAPQLVARWREVKEAGDQDTALNRCAEMCLDLASGRFDPLSGRYLIPEDDFAALLRDAPEGPAAGVLRAS